MPLLKGAFDTLGVEIETTTLPPTTLQSVLREIGLDQWQVTHDASIETPGSFLRGSPMFFLKARTPLRGLSSVTLGAELVSTPLSLETITKESSSLILALLAKGETQRSKRASLHVHCGVPNTLSFLRKIILFGTRFESLFYQLGGMGYAFRGTSNHAIYCRPVGGMWGSPVVTGNDSCLYQVSDLSAASKSRSSEEFWRALGIDTENVQRYHPARYYGINPLSVLLHGTLEFRYFNKCMVVPYVSSIINLVHSCTEFIFRAPEELLNSLPEASVFETQDNHHLLKVLLQLISQYNQDSEITPNSVTALSEILKKSPPVLLPKSYIFSHLRQNFTLSSDFYGSERRVRIRDEVLEPGQVDIHNFEGSEFNIFEEIK